MPELFGRAAFPGVNQVISCQYSLVHGISAGVATLEIVPQTGFIGAGGTLALFDGNVTLEFRDCKVDSSSLRVSSGGFITSLAIFDRRWKWAFGTLSGTYNLREENGALDPFRLQTPQQLAVLALLAMGEQGFDVSQMPNDVFPLVEWDHDNPAEMLADLASKVGCRVVLRLNGTVQVARTGVGQELPRPRQDILEDSLTINPPERPDGITVVCGPTRFQVDFLLEAVGKDTDGVIRAIDNLSYKPTAGWIGQVPPDFDGVSDTPTAVGIIPRELARDTVFRWYRVQNRDLDGVLGLIVPGYPFRLRFIEQILPIEDVQTETFVDAVDDREKSLPAVVSGTFYGGRLDFANQPAGTVYTDKFAIDRELGIVQLEDPAVQYNDDGEWEPADLQLRTACSVRDAGIWALVRYERTFFFPGPRFRTGNQQIRKDKLQLNVAGNPLNEPMVIREADREIAYAALAYQVPLPQSILYAGLKSISPDGAIQEVAWSVGPTGCTTRASRNDEFSVVQVPFEQRRAQERVRGDLLQQVQTVLSGSRQLPGNRNRPAEPNTTLKGRLLF